MENTLYSITFLLIILLNLLVMQVNWEFIKFFKKGSELHGKKNIIERRASFPLLFSAYNIFYDRYLLSRHA